ncbi:hypothetical protein TNCV_2178731 [Trichonephila clavipes]|uniref:Uncharacterized protein n=1 Tax=Trichonephila clavipes TaxID=2585209 RepID=A0A8X6VU95_TRICX|nr:hypothetical protein TNCV_2178731 [Trichonephila clavipes]
MKIQLSDVGEESRSVQVLRGSDIIGKLMTGQRRILSCGLVAMETIFGLTLSGLQVTTYKLKKENLFKEYGDGFKEWKREGIIEEVLKEELKSVSHYLPHRHVW